MSRLIYFIAAVAVFIAACEEDKGDFQKCTGDIVITSGYVCGWCSGADSLTLGCGQYNYVAFNPCSPNEVSVDNSGEITQTEWEDLLATLDFKEFSSIEINTCHVCADGCDYWVRVKYGNEEHKITFGHGSADSAVIAPVLPFIEKLDELKAGFIQE